MSRQYIEIDSTYRNRNGFKNPSEFELDFNTPIMDPHLAIDPVSDQAPIKFWDFEDSNGASYIDPNNNSVSVSSSSTDNLTLDIKFQTTATHALSKENDYYNNVVVSFNNENRRIVKYKFLSTDNASPETITAQITLEYAFSITPTSIDFTDPNIKGTNPSHIFVPGGGIYDNTYVGYYLHDDVNGTFDKIVDYDSITHRVEVKTNIGTLPKKYSIRKSPPVYRIEDSTQPTPQSLDIKNGYIPSSILSLSSVIANRHLNWIRDPSDGQYYRITSFNKDTHTITGGNTNNSTTQLLFTSPIEEPKEGDEIIYNGQTRTVKSVSGSGTTTVTVTLDEGFTSTVRLYTDTTTNTELKLLDLGTLSQNDKLTYNGQTVVVNNVTPGTTYDTITILSAFTPNIPQYQPVSFTSEEKEIRVTVTNTTLTVDSGGNLYDVLMIGSKVVYKNQTREVVSFTTTTTPSATLNSSFITDLNNEKVRLPPVSKTVDVITVGTTLTLSSNGNTNQDLTVGGVISYRGDKRKIVVLSNTTATLDYGFSPDIEGAYVTKTDATIPNTTEFTLVQKSGVNNITFIGNNITHSAIELLSNTYDNNSSLQYTGSISSQSQLVCHEIELLHIILPNKVLKHHRGGRVSRHPYIYVELSNLSSGQNRHNIYSNNPHAVKALFKCSIRDISYPVQSPYVKLDGGGMVQTIKFKPTDRLYFRVILSDGKVFEVEDEETFNPLPPNPSIQINAMFSIRRV